MKTCTMCKRDRDDKHFHSGVARCIPCARKLRKQAEPVYKETRKWRWIWDNYKLTQIEYETLWEMQGKACMICEQPTENIHVDHCHTTGDIRGLLCGPCNQGIGSLKDDPARLIRAAEYVGGAL